MWQFKCKENRHSSYVEIEHIPDDAITVSYLSTVNFYIGYIRFVSHVCIHKTEYLTHINEHYYYLFYISLIQTHADGASRRHFHRLDLPAKFATTVPNCRMSDRS